MFAESLMLTMPSIESIREILGQEVREQR